jgi:lipoprotein-anchoring transpeptidase ErfK/SrfK
MGDHTRRRRAVVWLTAGVTACAVASATAAQPAPRAIASRPTTKEAWTARVVLPVHTRAAPRASARKTSKLSVVAPYNGGPHVLLVTGARASRADGVWYRVRLTSRPNDAAGWVPEQAVRVERTSYRIVVRLGARTLQLYKAGAAVGTWKVAVGTTTNPTPTGSFALSEIVRQANPKGFFGPYILTLSAHSLKLSDFDGGDGRVALHGTSQPGLLGQAVSHGCVRLANAVVTRLGRTVPAGAPVEILP